LGGFRSGFWRWGDSFAGSAVFGLSESEDASDDALSVLGLSESLGFSV
jgi:hypothetical protein